MRKRKQGMLFTCLLLSLFPKLTASAQSIDSFLFEAFSNPEITEILLNSDNEKSITYELIPPSDLSDNSESRGKDLHLVPQEGQPTSMGQISKPPDNVSDKKKTDLLNMKTKEEACKALDNWIITYYDQISLVEKCKQRLIQKADILNTLVSVYKKNVVEVPVQVYRLIPFGTDFEREDLLNIQGNNQQIKLTDADCKKINGKYVTLTGMTFFYIENCKRRQFDSLVDMERHNKEKSPIISIEPEVFYRIPQGENLAFKEDKESSILMQMDGDVEWSKLNQASENKKELTKDSLESLEKIEAKKNLKANLPATCKKYDGKIVSFYSEIFFITKCKKIQIKDFTLELQQKAEELGGVVDLTVSEYNIVPDDTTTKLEDLLKLIK